MPETRTGWRKRSAYHFCYLLLAGPYEFNPFAIPPLGTAAILLVLALAVPARERRSPASVLFAVLSLALTIWLAAFGMMQLSGTQRLAQFWCRIGYLGIPFIPAALYNFTLTLSKDCAASVYVCWLGSSRSSPPDSATGLSPRRRAPRCGTPQFSLRAVFLASSCAAHHQRWHLAGVSCATSGKQRTGSGFLIAYSSAMFPRVMFCRPSGSRVSG